MVKKPVHHVLDGNWLLCQPKKLGKLLREGNENQKKFALLIAIHKLDIKTMPEFLNRSYRTVQNWLCLNPKTKYYRPMPDWVLEMLELKINLKEKK